MPITSNQREALKRVFRRTPLFHEGTAQHLAAKAGWVFKYDPEGKIASCWTHPRTIRSYMDASDVVIGESLGTRMTYRQFRRQAYQTSDGTIIIPWQDMVIGIEPDGYTHS